MPRLFSLSLMITAIIVGTESHPLAAQDARRQSFWDANSPLKTKFVKQEDGTWKSSDDGGPARQVWKVTGITANEIRLESSNAAGKIYGTLSATEHVYWMDGTDKTRIKGKFK